MVQFLMQKRWCGMNRLETSLGKLKLKNPISVASGTFGLEYESLVDFNKLGAIVTKTITKNYKAGNKPPRLFETSGGLLNSIGLQNPGLEGFIKDVLPEYRKFSSPLIVSFSGSTVSEFKEILSELDNQESIAGYEVNVSCPNVENEGIAFGTNAETVYKLTKELSAITDRELIIKLTPNVTSISEIAIAAQEGGADSLALINTLLGMAIDWETGQSYFKRGVAGYSGPPIKPVALRLVHEVAKNVSIPILAMGGIKDYKDVLEFIYAGASAVSIGTYNFVNPTATTDAIVNLEKFFAERDITIIDIKNKIKGLE